MSNIIIKLYNNISKCFYLLNFIFIISFRNLFLFNELKFFFINNIFIDFLLGFILLLLFKLKLDIFKLGLFLLSFLSKLPNFLFLLFKFLNVSEDWIVEFQSRGRFVILIGLVFINIDDFSLNNLLLRTLLGLLVFIFKLLFWNVD